MTRARALLPYAAALPLALLVVLTIAHSGGGLMPWGDHAVVQTEILGAGSGDQLLGTYSRYEWHHPGPAMFYLLYVPFELFGASTGAVNAAVALLNLLAVGAIVLVAARCGGRLVAAWAAVVAGVYLLALGADPLRDYWVPHAVAVPFGLFVVLCAACASGRVWFLPAAAFVGTALMQTNLSMAGTVGALGGAALLACALGQDWLRRGPRLEWRRWAPFVLGALIVALMWIPPVYEEATNTPGNMAQVRDFFGEESSTHGLGDASEAVAAVSSVIPLGTGGVGDDIDAGAGAVLVFVLFLALLIAGTVVAIRRRRRFAAALCALSLIGILAELYATTQVRGPIHGYIVLWFSSLTIAGWTGIGAALAPELQRERLTRAAAIALPAALLIVAVVNTVAVARQTPIDQVDAYDNAEVRTVVERARAYLDAHDSGGAQVFITQPDRWPTAAGMILQFDREDRPVAVTREWHFMFGDRFDPDGREDTALIFTNTSLGPEGVTLTREHEKIATAGDTTVYAAPYRPDPRTAAGDQPVPRIEPTPAGD